MSFNFGRDYHKNIILDRMNLTSKYGVRSVAFENDDIGLGNLSQQNIENEDSLNDIPLVKQVKKECLEIDLKLMCFDDKNNPKVFTDGYIQEMTRLFVGKNKQVRELRIGDYLYYGYFTNVQRNWATNKIGYLSATFKLASPNCYTIRLLNEVGVENGSASIELSNRSTGTEYLYPDIFIKTQSACSYINIINANDNSTFRLTNIPNQADIYFYGDNMNQFEDRNKETNIDYFGKWNLINLRLVYGVNTIVLESDGKVNIGIIFQNELTLF